jgi:dipeptidyl aminopeptidase/acylaminoacyl peptidase
MLAVGAVALLALGWAAATMIVRAPAAPATTPLYLSVPMPAKPRFDGFATIAPDERSLLCTVWTATNDDSSRPTGQLMVRRLDRDEFKLVDGTEGARSAAFSPDGRSLVFVAAKDRTGRRSQVRRMSVVSGQPSGTPETLYETQGFAGEVCWVSNQEILLATPWNDSLLLLSTNGAAPRVVLREESKKDLGSWGSVHAVGDGRHVLVTRWRIEGPTQKEWMELVDVQGGTRSTILEGAGGARVVELGAGARGVGGAGGAGGCYLVGSRGSSAIVAAPFDRASLKVTGPAVTVWSGRGVRGFDSQRGDAGLRTQAGRAR